MENDQFQRKQDSVYSVKVNAGKRRTYFFDVRKTKGEDFYLTLTESNGCQTFRRFIVTEPVNPANFFTPNFNPNTLGSGSGSSTSGI